jgi:uncharacterized glyoxalase superfamily protein PhnB
MIITLDDPLTIAAHPDPTLSPGRCDTLVGGLHSIYVVTGDPDGLYARATAAGAEILQGLRDEHHGSGGFSVRDPEGNLWSFGTYRGEPAKAE